MKLALSAVALSLLAVSCGGDTPKSARKLVQEAPELAQGPALDNPTDMSRDAFLLAMDAHQTAYENVPVGLVYTVKSVERYKKKVGRTDINCVLTHRKVRTVKAVAPPSVTTDDVSSVSYNNPQCGQGLDSQTDFDVQTPYSTYAQSKEYLASLPNFKIMSGAIQGVLHYQWESSGTSSDGPWAMKSIIRPGQNKLMLELFRASGTGGKRPTSSHTSTVLGRPL